MGESWRRHHIALADFILKYESINIFEIGGGHGTLAREYIKEQEDKTPLGRIAEAEDIGKALVTIAESFTFSTGCIFPVDGGRPLT